MTDTLFDLDALTVAPVSERSTKPLDPSLGKAIAGRATMAMKASSDAIAAWCRGSVLSGTSEVLRGLFVDQWSMDHWRVVNVAQRDTEDVSVRFARVDADDGVRIFPAARLALDGSVVDVTGTRMIPLSQIPEVSADGKQRQSSFYLTRGWNMVSIVAEKGLWAVFRAVGADLEEDADFVGLRSEAVEIPPSLFPVCDGGIAEQVQSRLFSLHIQRLTAAVASIQAAPISRESIFSAAAFLAANNRGGRRPFSPAVPADFAPEEASVLAPVLDMFAWTIAASDWEGQVEIDTSSGWRVDVDIEATHLATGERVATSIDVLTASAAELAVWFSAETREAAAIKELERARRDSVAPADGGRKPDDGPGGRKRAKRAPLATTEQMEALKQAVTFLKPRASSPEEARVLGSAEEVCAQAKPETVVVAAAMASIGTSFGRLVDQTTTEIRHVLSLREWTRDQLTGAVGMAQFADALREVISFSSDDVRELRAFVDAASAPFLVMEVAPGWWVSREHNGQLHGAVSSTGFFSGFRCSDADTNEADGQIDPKEMLSHLMESPAGMSESMRYLVKSGDCPRSVADWLKSLPLEPDNNAARAVARLVRGKEQVNAIRRNIERALSMLEGESPSPTDLPAVMASLDCDSVPEGADRDAALIAAAMVKERFGRKAEAAKPKEAGLFDEGPVPQDDEGEDVGDEEGECEDE